MLVYNYQIIVWKYHYPKEIFFKDDPKIMIKNFEHFENFINFMRFCEPLHQWIVQRILF